MADLHLKIRNTPDQEVDNAVLIGRGVSQLMPEHGLVELMNSRRIRLYLGIDPTSPLLHIGHMVPLMKLKQFQMAGHEVILLLGTFTGMIGDPTDKSATRVQLTTDQIQKNVATYVEQAGTILDLSDNAENPIRIVRNDEWLAPITLAEFLEIAATVKVKDLIERKSFQERLRGNGSPLFAHEILYPILQGQDAVALDVDLEVGGQDQVMNMLVGRDMQKERGREKHVLGLSLIEDPSGAKMGKTTGNVVNLIERPEVIFEALMLWPDTTIGLGLELLTLVEQSLIEEVAKHVENQLGLHPFADDSLKRAFAWRVVRDLKGHEAADAAEEEFLSVMRDKNLPTNISTVAVSSTDMLTKVLVEAELFSDVLDAEKALTQGAIFVDGRKQRANIRMELLCDSECLLSLGKKTIKNIRRVVITQ